MRSEIGMQDMLRHHVYGTKAPLRYSRGTAEADDAYAQPLHNLEESPAMMVLAAVKAIPYGLEVLECLRNNPDRMPREFPFDVRDLDMIVTGAKPSVITLNPAIRYQFKTGQREWPKT